MRSKSRVAIALSVASLFGLASVGSSATAATKTTKKATKTTKKKAAATTKAATAATTASTAAPATTAAKRENFASGKGVTKDTIKIGIVVATLESLVRVGIQFAPFLRDFELAKKTWTQHTDAINAAGGINGRKLEVKILQQDPLDPAAYQKICNTVGVDDQFFAVITGIGYNNDFMDCMTKQGKTLVLASDTPASSNFDNVNGNLISLVPAFGSLGETGIKTFVQTGNLPKDATLGVLAGNTAPQKNDTEKWLKELGRQGIKVAVKEEIPTASLDTNAMNAAARNLVQKFRENNVTHVLFGVNETGGGNAFADEAAKNGYKFKYYRFGCPFTSIISNSLEGYTGVCARKWYFDKGSKPLSDTPVEAACRKRWDDTFPTFKSVPGAPAGGVRLENGTYTNGEYYDYTCSLISVLKLGIEGAGADLNTKTFTEALIKAGNIPLAGYSNGVGKLTADKPYLSSSVQIVNMRIPSLGTVKGEDGYAGCAAPAPCWQAASDWLPIQ